MNERIGKELDLLRKHFPDLIFREEGAWVLLPSYGDPGSLWEQDSIQVCFQFPPGYVAQRPYGFFVSPRLRLKSGDAIDRYADSGEPPFEGSWGKFSWELQDWRPTGDLVTGTNMLNFVLSFADRLKEGR